MQESAFYFRTIAVKKKTSVNFNINISMFCNSFSEVKFELGELKQKKL